MSLQTLWHLAQGNSLDAEEVAKVVVQAELLGALNTVLALRKAVEQVFDVDKQLVLEMLDHLRDGILEAMSETVNVVWPYSRTNEVFRPLELGGRSPDSQVKAASQS